MASHVSSDCPRERDTPTEIFIPQPPEPPRLRHCIHNALINDSYAK